jgi:hypothetical protein
MDPEYYSPKASDPLLWANLPEGERRAINWGIQRLYWRLVQDGYETHAEELFSDFVNDTGQNPHMVRCGDWT